MTKVSVEHARSRYGWYFIWTVTKVNHYEFDAHDRGRFCYDMAPVLWSYQHSYWQVQAHLSTNLLTTGHYWLHLSNPNPRAFLT